MLNHAEVKDLPSADTITTVVPTWTTDQLAENLKLVRRHQRRLHGLPRVPRLVRTRLALRLITATIRLEMASRILGIENWATEQRAHGTARIRRALRRTGR